MSKTIVHRAGFSVAETAKSLGITPHAAYQAITAGDIETTRVGSRIYIPARWFRDQGLDTPAGACL
ncbi:helix-turn-helix domain-containing protein [Arthrobacter sp. STN4]|uniref:helix-turn-helix domain-containing protein n=1 Tax=Arthrobacter sp. STN4 TaxID=2923276 RepID=UPI00211A96E9|nr:helix-turn-helix domain-containing protein [Arthrobacter sp. STN4]MCQ9162948.1 helix-turn-helix domain-containing protein [Arthrobacter sp. STN4]